MHKSKNDEFKAKRVWHELRGKIKQQWGKLTDIDLKAIEADLDQAAPKIQSAYGYTKERAAQEFDSFKKLNLSRSN